MNPQLQSVLRNELQAHEQLLWSAQPNARQSAFGANSGCAAFFGLIWTGFILLWMGGWLAGSWAMGDGLFGIGFGLLGLAFGSIFLLVGLALMSSPYWAYRAARRTVYAITERRILVIEAKRTKSVSSYYDVRAADIKRTERPNGTGSLVFNQEEYKDSDGDKQIRKVEFKDIADVRGVEQLVLQTFCQAHPTDAPYQASPSNWQQVLTDAPWPDNVETPGNSWPELNDKR